jgi:hypothetical protein
MHKRRRDFDGRANASHAGQGFRTIANFVAGRQSLGSPSQPRQLPEHPIQCSRDSTPALTSPTAAEIARRLRCQPRLAKIDNARPRTLHLSIREAVCEGQWMAARV